MPEPLTYTLEQAVFQTLLYSDIFDYPLTAREVHRYLQGVSATYQEVWQVLNEDPRFQNHGTYFALRGRDEVVNLRRDRELYSQGLLPFALRYGKWIGALPFVRMVALTGSLAVRNASNGEDFDYMLVTVPGRLWTARAFVLLLGRLVKIFGHTICPNLIVSERALAWQQRDLYAARELYQMIPIAGHDVYEQLMQANRWAAEFLPNASLEPEDRSSGTSGNWGKFVQWLLEVLLRGRLGERFEVWEMNRKIARFSKQAGVSDETLFSADLCQGHFDRHRARTHNELRERLNDSKSEPARMKIT